MYQQSKRGKDVKKDVKTVLVIYYLFILKFCISEKEFSKLIVLQTKTILQHKIPKSIFCLHSSRFNDP